MVKFESSEFLNHIKSYPPEVQNFIKFILNKNISLTLVGGSVRDYLLVKKHSKDLDFEIMPNEKMDISSWKSQLASLYKELFKSYDVEKLNFDVLRVKILDYEVELAPARRETYLENTLNEYSHSDFGTELLVDKNFGKSFERRDFSINAIGVEFSIQESELSLSLQDPYQGLDDLNNKIIRPYSRNFSKDPVRFLRAIRFKVMLDFEYDSKLFNEFKFSNIKKISKYYLDLESKKVGFNTFFSEMTSIVQKYEVGVSESLAVILANINSKTLQAKSWEDVIWNLLSEGNYSNVEVELVQSFLSIKKKRVLEMKNLISFVSGLDRDDFNSLCKFEDPSELSNPELDKLRQLNSAIKLLDKSDGISRLKSLSNEKLVFFEKVKEKIELIKTNEKHLEKRRELEENRRSIYFIWLSLKAL